MLKLIREIGWPIFLRLAAHLVPISIALGGMVYYTFLMYSMDLLIMNIRFIFSLLVALVVLTVAYAMMVHGVFRLIGAIQAQRQLLRQSIYDIRAKHRVYRQAIILAFTSLFTLGATAFMINWGDLGALLRGLVPLPFLPEGNLLIAGGRAGWAYASMTILLIFGLFWHRMKAWTAWIIAASPASATRRIEKEEFEPRLNPADISSETTGESFEGFGGFGFSPSTQ